MNNIININNGRHIILYYSSISLIRFFSNNEVIIWFCKYISNKNNKKKNFNILLDDLYLSKIYYYNIIIYKLQKHNDQWAMSLNCIFDKLISSFLNIN